MTTPAEPQKIRLLTEAAGNATYALKGEGGGGGAVESGSALGVVRARVLARAAAPVPLVFAGSSTTRGGNVAVVNRWVDRIAATVTDLPVKQTYEIARDSVPFPTGITFVNMGRTGHNSGTYMTVAEATIIGGWNPAMVMHSIGANDAVSMYSPQQVGANIAARIDAIDAAATLPVAHVLMHQHERQDTTLREPWPNYLAGLRTIAASRPNVAVLDLASTFDTLGIADTDPMGIMAADLVHVNTTGHALYSDLIGAYLPLPLKAVTGGTTPPDPDPIEPEVLVADSFDRADGPLGGSTSQTGHVWQTLSGAPAIVSGRVDTGTSTGTAVIPVLRPDVDIRVTARFSGAAGIGGIAFRSLDINNRWGVFFNRASFKAQIFRMVAGANTIPITGEAFTFPADGVDFPIRVRVSGRQVDVWVENALVLTYQMTEADDTATRTWDKIGFRVTDKSLSFDNLEVLSVV